MATLYIIGNGFDIHFGLKTKPEDFIEILSNKQIYNQMDNAYDYMRCYGVTWNEYERSLADFELDEMEEENIIYPDYMSEHESDRDVGIVNMQMYVDSITDAIDSSLIEMTKNADEDILRIQKADNNVIALRKCDAVLTFNYTSTIERLFDTKGIPIMHIHGCLKEGSKLILGYKDANNIYKQKQDFTQKNHENGFEDDYYIAQQRNILLTFYEYWKKPIQTEKLEKFLNKLSNIDRVVVLGHSMEDIDAPYMEMIEKVLKPSEWHVSFYDDEDKKRRIIKTYSFANKVKLFFW